MNIDFTKNNYKFTARVSAIIFNESKIKFCCLKLMMEEIILCYLVAELNCKCIIIEFY